MQRAYHHTLVLRATTTFAESQEEAILRTENMARRLRELAIGNELQLPQWVRIQPAAEEAEVIPGGNGKFEIRFPIVATIAGQSEERIESLDKELCTGLMERVGHFVFGQYAHHAEAVSVRKLVSEIWVVSR
jgi:hypothetical protein